MGLDLKVIYGKNCLVISDPMEVKKRIRNLTAFVAEPKEDEFWLKGVDSLNTWEYDVRLIIKSNDFWIEIISAHLHT